MLDKAIEHGKEHRKPYRKSKRFDWTCRNHGRGNHRGHGAAGNQCLWCLDDKIHSAEVRKAQASIEEDVDIDILNHTYLKEGI